jgi:hypothetical protein
MFQILDEMNQKDEENNTAAVAVSGDFVAAKTAKGGGHVTIGVPAEVITQLFLNERVAVLLIIDKKEYDRIDKESKKIEPSIYTTSPEPINLWFELSRAQYLTVPRSVMQAMPVDWQLRMAECLDQLDATIDWRPKEGRYWVKLKNDNGRYIHDPLMNYRHPDPGVIKFKTKERSCRVCGCTENDCRQCVEKTGKPCCWVAEDLCSACV